MPVNFTVIGRVLSKTGPPSHRVAIVQHKDSDEVLQEIEIIYWEDVELSALPDTIYRIFGAGLHKFRPGFLGNRTGDEAGTA